MWERKGDLLGLLGKKMNFCGKRFEKMLDKEAAFGEQSRLN
jgi:hypothetical protein